jgi:sialate O-acetylesterase
MDYFHKMKALINGWRKVWNQGDFPFYYVQLAPFRYKRNDPCMLPRIWEAQRAAMAIPNTGMAVITDIGNLDDIHPKNKKEVGRRLALWALANTYGVSRVVCSGPLYRSMRVEDGAVRLFFDHAEQLESRDGKALSWFTIAGTDRKFEDAAATVDGNTVLVRSEKVAEPAAVRFAWHEEAEPNLVNGAGLPASPFRTDDWPPEENPQVKR